MTKDPFFASFRQEVDRMFEHLVHRSWPASGTAQRFSLPLDVLEEPDRYWIEADLPGVESDAVSVTAEGGLLRIEGVRKRAEHAAAVRHYVMERSVGRFFRAVHLPADADPQHLRAHLREGVLHIEIPKRTVRRMP